MMKRNIKWIALILIMCFVAAVLIRIFFKHDSEDEKRTIVIGSKNFTESVVLAHMIADIIEDRTELKVIRKINLGGTSLTWKALNGNEIQIYPEYSRTIILNFYNQDSKLRGSFEQANELLQQHHFSFINKLGIDNGYVLAVSKATKEKYNLETIGDLIALSPQLSCGSDFEFKDRPDGYLTLIAKYGLNFKHYKTMNAGILYRAILNGQLDVIVTTTTNAQLNLNGMVVLKDDRVFCPPYDAGILVRHDTLEAYPELADALTALEGSISNQEITEVNLKVDFEGKKAKVVAHEFLRQKGLLTRKN